MSRIAPIIAVFALLAVATPGFANEKDMSTKDAGKTAREVKSDRTAAESAGAITFANKKDCIDNPRFNPDNDESGPRASEPTTDASPYVSTPTASSGVACR